MKKTNELISERFGGGKWISSVFYEKSKNKTLSDTIGKIPKDWITIHFKTYPRLHHLGIGKLKSKKIKEFLVRRSTRLFTGESMDFKIFSRIVYTAAGITEKNQSINYSRRSYPSAGARYSLETYIIALNVKGLKEGLYHYNVKNNLLEIMLLENMKDYVLDITGNEEWLLNADFLVLLTGIPDRLRVKYGERGFRYMLIEAGHLAQNFCLLAASEDFGSCPIGGFIESKVISLLDIGNVNEYPIYLLSIGKQER